MDVRLRTAVGAVSVAALLASCGARVHHAASAPAQSSGPAASATQPVPALRSAAAGATAPTAAPTTSRPMPNASPPACPYPSSGFDCDFQRRFAAAQAYLRGRPGTVGIVVRDRVTGAVWRNSYAGDLVWTASTIKLAMTVDLLLRDRAGTITLTDADRGLIHNMLNWSDDDAADTLWSKYGRDDFATRFPNYGLTGVTFVSGFSRYWGYMKCTPNDLDRLINYVLTRLPADLRGYVVNEMRHVGTNQQWGVWGAGPAAQPGNKDGWSLEQGGWVINSVGFVGPNERYTLSMMNSLRGEGGYDAGVQTITHAAAVLFSGRF
jgi:hypothetical protein